MTYKTDLNELTRQYDAYEISKANFDSIYLINPRDSRLNPIAIGASNKLDAAQSKLQEMVNKMAAHEPGYPKVDSKRQAFLTIQNKMAEAWAERKKRRKRKVFAAEGRQKVEKIKAQYKAEMTEIRTSARDNKKLIKSAPGIKWTTRLDRRLTNTGVTLTAKGKTIAKRMRNKWRTKKNYGLGFHLIGRAKSRKFRRMRP